MLQRPKTVNWQKNLNLNLIAAGNITHTKFYSTIRLYLPCFNARLPKNTKLETSTAVMIATETKNRELGKNFKFEFYRGW